MTTHLPELSYWLQAHSTPILCAVLTLFPLVLIVWGYILALREK